MAATLTEHFKEKAENAKTSKRIKTQERRNELLQKVRNDAKEASDTLASITSAKWFINMSTNRKRASSILGNLRLYRQYGK